MQHLSRSIYLIIIIVIGCIVSTIHVHAFAFLPTPAQWSIIHQVVQSAKNTITRIDNLNNNPKSFKYTPRIATTKCYFDHNHDYASSSLSASA